MLTISNTDFSLTLEMTLSRPSETAPFLFIQAKHILKDRFGLIDISTIINQIP